MKKVPCKHKGFTLLELLIVLIIIILGGTWSIPQYRRKMALNQLDKYSREIESGLFSLRARQSAEGTSCEININPSFVGLNNLDSGTFGSAVETLELKHLNKEQRSKRLNCCDATSCEWTKPYRLISEEGSRSSNNVAIKFSKAKYRLSPPGLSTGNNPLIILVKYKNKGFDPQHPLPIRCIKLSTAGHLHHGTWEQSRCRSR